MSNIDLVISSLKFLGIKPDVNSYNSRFLIQKITYLAQALGMPTNYRFTIHVAGPYSKALECDYYRELNRVNSLETNYVLKSDDFMILEKIKECCTFSENPLLLECISTAVYLKMENIELQDNDIFLSIKKLKPHLGEYLTLRGITKAKELLFKPEFLTEEIKKEIQLWDRADD